MIRLNAMRLLLGVICALMLAACASMGRPEGGPRDELPPVFVSSNPAPGSLNVNRNRITLTFDENVQLTEASSKVVISPVQKQMPSISAAAAISMWSCATPCCPIRPIPSISPMPSRI